MTQTVAVALITAFAGFAGALVGAAAAVFGPWWLHKAQREAEARDAAAEARRLAIVTWTDANVALANAIEAKDEKAIAKWALAANAAQTEVLSRLDRDDTAVRVYLSQATSTLSFYEDVEARRTAAARAGAALLAWHLGVEDHVKLTPYVIASFDGTDPMRPRVLEFPSWDGARSLLAGMPTQLWRMPGEEPPERTEAPTPGGR